MEFKGKEEELQDRQTSKGRERRGATFIFHRDTPDFPHCSWMKAYIKVWKEDHVENTENMSVLNEGQNRSTLKNQPLIL